MVQSEWGRRKEGGEGKNLALKYSFCVFLVFLWWCVFCVFFFASAAPIFVSSLFHFKFRSFISLGSPRGMLAAVETTPSARFVSLGSFCETPAAHTHKRHTHTHETRKKRREGFSLATRRAFSTKVLSLPPSSLYPLAVGCVGGSFFRKTLTKTQKTQKSTHTGRESADVCHERAVDERNAKLKHWSAPSLS